MAFSLAGQTLPYPKKETPKMELPNREIDRAIGGGGLMYEAPMNMRQYSYTWEPVTDTQKTTLFTAYLAARSSIQDFYPFDEDTTCYDAYAKNWKCKYITRGVSTYYYTISFDIIVTGVTV